MVLTRKQTRKPTRGWKWGAGLGLGAMAALGGMSRVLPRVSAVQQLTPAHRAAAEQMLAEDLRATLERMRNMQRRMRSDPNIHWNGLDRR